jgi:DNA repair exonuclease SbcCD ATPase subunit
MQTPFATIVVLSSMLAVSNALTSDVTPIEKVLQMLSDLESKVITEGKDAQKVYDEFAEFCEIRSKNVGFEIKQGTAEVNELKAAIAQGAATAQSLNAKIEELAAAIATSSGDLKAATEIRAKERAAFEAQQTELTDVIGTLQRAIVILEKEMSKTGASSMMQLKSATSIAEALSVMVQASSLSTADASKLTALVQSSEQDGDEELAAPAGSVYKSSSGGVVATLQELFDKAEAQLEEARKSETKSLQAYSMLAQSLKDEIKYANEDMDRAKKDLGASNEAKATAEGDLSVTSSDLSEDSSTLATLHQDCMKGAEDFEAETKSRGEELKALATAKKVIQESTSTGAADLSYSFLQVSRSALSSSADLANFEAVRFVRDLAQKQNSPALAQLAQRMAQAMRASGQSGDPFAKVKSLINNMIERLSKEGDADATENSFCEKELSETAAKKSDREATIEKLSASIDSMTAKSSKLKEQGASLQKQLAALAGSQAEADKLRAEEKAAYDVNSAEMEKGIKGVQLALKVLNEYYAKDSSASVSSTQLRSSGNGIISLLEVVESDFSKGYAEMKAAEESAVSEYQRLSKANDIEKATKMQDLKYKTKEAKSLDKATSETNADKSTVLQELDAVNEYNTGIKARCVAKAETYAERSRRRQEEIAGLKEALSILEGEAVLLQQASRHMLRGIRA